MGYDCVKPVHLETSPHEPLPDTNGMPLWHEMKGSVRKSFWEDYLGQLLFQRPNLKIFRTDDIALLLVSSYEVHLLAYSSPGARVDKKSPAVQREAAALLPKVFPMVKKASASNAPR